MFDFISDGPFAVNTETTRKIFRRVEFFLMDRRLHLRLQVLGGYQDSRRMMLRAVVSLIVSSSAFLSRALTILAKFRRIR